jgi:hypothetical protein
VPADWQPEKPLFPPPAERKTMEQTERSTRLTGNDAAGPQEADHTAQRHLSRSRELRDQARYSTSAMEDTLLRCQAMALEYQTLMRMMTRPQPIHDGSADRASASGRTGCGGDHGC